MNSTPGVSRQRVAEAIGRLDLQGWKIDSKDTVVEAKWIQYVYIPALAGVHATAHQPKVAPIVG